MYSKYISILLIISIFTSLFPIKIPVENSRPSTVTIQNNEYLNQPLIYYITGKNNDSFNKIIYDFNLIPGQLIEISVITPKMKILMENGLDLTSSIIINRSIDRSIETSIISENNTHKLHPSQLTNGDILSMNNLWDQGINGDNVVIAVLDTGIDFDHPSLLGKKYLEKSFVLKKFGYTENEDTKDYFGHGTSVSSLIAGNDDSLKVYSGMAKNSLLINAKIGSKEALITSAGLLAAVDWAASINEVDIINLSIGEPEDSEAIDVLEQIVNAAVKNDKIVVTSAGNNGQISAPFTIGSPGSAKEVITVGASNLASNLAKISSKGPTMSLLAKPDIVAPGIQIEVAKISSDYSSCSSNTCYRYLSGTSFSAPLISGLIATVISGLKAQNKNYSPGSVKAALHKTAKDLGYSSYSQGSGLANGSATYEILNRGDSISYVFPDRIPYNLFRKLPAGESITVPLTLIDFQKTKWEIKNILGNASDFISITLPNSTLGYSTIGSLKFSTSKYINIGVYQSIINLQSLSGNSVSVMLNIEVIKSMKYRLLLDLLHSPWDSVVSTSSKSRLDIKYGVDMSDFVRILNDADIWVEEIYSGELTYDLLKDYDIILMPSAFTIFNPPVFDHEINRNTLITNQELFALYEYKQKGGKFIIDFGGVSQNDFQFEYTIPDESSLKSLLSLFGISIGDVVQDTKVSRITTNSPLQNYTTVAGRIPIYNGISIYDLDDSSRSSFYLGGHGETAFISNARNWRDQIRMNELEDKGPADFARSIVNLVKKEAGIVSFQFMDNEFFGKIVDTPIETDEFKISIYSQLEGESDKISINNLSISESGEFKGLISGDYTDQLIFKLQYRDEIFRFVKAIDQDEMRISTISEPNFDISSSNILQWKLNIIDNDEVLRYNYQIITDNINSKFNFSTSLFNNILTITIDNPKQLEAVTSINFMIKIIDVYGKMNTFYLESQAIITQDKLESYLVSIIGIFIFITGIILLKINWHKFKNLKR